MASASVPASSANTTYATVMIAGTNQLAMNVHTQPRRPRKPRRPAPWSSLVGRTAAASRVPARSSQPRFRVPPLAASPDPARSWAPPSHVARDPHRDLERLLVVEPRIDAALVRALEAGLVEPARAADALGDVVAGELEVNAAEARAELRRGARSSSRARSTILSNRRVLMPCGVVSVLPCIGSHTHSTRAAGRAHRLDQRRQLRAHLGRRPCDGSA